MLVIKGIYEHGQIRLLEPVPAETPEPTEVTVTFAQPDNSELNEEATNAALGIIGLLNDLTPEQLADFDEAVRSFSLPRTRFSP